MKLASSPVREFFDHDGVSGRTEASGQHRGRGLDGRLVSLADHDSLAGGEAVGLHHDREPLSSNVCRVEVGCIERGIAQRTVCRAASGIPWYEPWIPPGERRRREGPKQARPAAANRSTMPATSGPSGPTMVKSMRSRSAKLSKRSVSVAAISTLKIFGSSAVPALPGGDEYPIHAPRLRAFPCERMFTAAAADDQDLHQWRK